MNRRGFFGRALGGFVAAVVGPKLLPKAPAWFVGDGCPGAWTANLVVSENLQVWAPGFYAYHRLDPLPPFAMEITDLSDKTLAGD